VLPSEKERIFSLLRLSFSLFAFLNQGQFQPVRLELLPFSPVDFNPLRPRAEKPRRSKLQMNFNTLKAFRQQVYSVTACVSRKNTSSGF